MTDRSDVVFNQTAHQLSLDIFAEALGKPPPITDAPASIGFMKSLATIDVADLSLLHKLRCHLVGHPLLLVPGGGGVEEHLAIVHVQHGVLLGGRVACR